MTQSQMAKQTITETIKPNAPRYRLYRVHKYLVFMFNRMLELAGKTNFTDPAAVEELRIELSSLRRVLHDHARHEERKIHALLKAKDLHCHEHVETDHKAHDQFFDLCEAQIIRLEAMHNPIERDAAGNEIYLDIRRFYAENLMHLDYEERVLLPQLQEHYPDQALRDILFETYHIMTPEQMFQMMKTLIPHLNYHDKYAFLKDMQDAEPVKLSTAWLLLAPLIKEQERNQLMKSLSIQIA